jgi:co-chaperonin GroES (HSP10)
MTFLSKIGFSAALALVWLSTALGQTPAAKAVGTVKWVSGNAVVLTTDAGGEANVTIAESARIVRTMPGQTDLKSATPIQASDIQVGDRVLARGTAGENNAVVASSVIVMKQSDIAERQQREREEWRRGVGGIVKAVDPAAETITVNNALAAHGKEIVVHITPQTQLLRYPANSINFEDAKPGAIDQIKPGDQLNARGTKNAEGTEFTAQAVVSGTFQNVAGTVISTDAANNTVTLNDLATKKPMVVKVGPESQMRKLPEFVAMMIAMRLKGGAAGETMAVRAQGAGNEPGGRTGASNAGGGAARGNGQGGAGTGGGFRGNGGSPDFQQMLNRLPAVTVADLKKGDAVMLVATAGTEPVAIKLLAGVEPILSAAPAGLNAAATVLSPWNLGQAAGGEGAAGP